ncbi:MAG: hypothetical protein KBD66_02010 [Candidatus Doudnabacteria bacterium]|nr:hypothetical protein [Candidatus Doudnabacteria bacterium]
MTKVRTVVVYDREMPRRNLYASHLRTRLSLPFAIVVAGSLGQVAEVANTADMVILSFGEGEGREDMLRCVKSVSAVVVIESETYTEVVYAEVALRGHFVRREHRLQNMFGSIVNILKH